MRDERAANDKPADSAQRITYEPLDDERKAYLRLEAERLVEGIRYRVNFEATDILALLDEIQSLRRDLEAEQYMTQNVNVPRIRQLETKLRKFDELREAVSYRGLSELLKDEGWEGRWNPLEHTNYGPLAQHTALVISEALKRGQAS